MALVALAAGAPAASAQGTAGELQAQVNALVDTTAAQWAALQRPDDVFQNPYPWDVAVGHPSYAPPLLTYALHRSGQRTANPALVAAAERAWPRSVDPQRASAFDMLGASAAYAELALTPARRAHLALYLSSYPVPINGRRCLLRPQCWSNLKLVDALAILAITRLGIVSATPGARLSNPAAARAAAIAVINQRVPQVAHRSLTARIRGTTLRRGAVISDPPRDPLAYHALTAFMLREAVALLGPEASRAARRASADALEALSDLMAPDGDVAYLGRGQGQVWVPGAQRRGAGRRGARRLRHPPRPRRPLPGGRAARGPAPRSAPRGSDRAPARAERGDPHDARRDRRLRVRRRLQRARALRAEPHRRRAGRDPRRARRRRSRPTAACPSSTTAPAAGSGSSTAAGSGSPSTARRATRATCATTPGRWR